MLQITENTSLSEIRKEIIKLREQKGKEKESLEIIEKALDHGHEFVVNLFWEEALTYQHLLMNEDAKGEDADKQVRSKNLLRMKEVVMRAKYYVVRFDLEIWKHRMYRFLGRLDDYSSDYKGAIKNYKRAIKYAKLDPEFTEKKVPRYLEVEAFLSYSLIESGEVNRGYRMALKTYESFDTDKYALLLKKNDYFTWAVWKSGIVIRTIMALIDKKSTIGKADLKDWLDDAEKTLVPEKSFSYRLSEVKMLKKMLLPN